MARNRQKYKKSLTLTTQQQNEIEPEFLKLATCVYDGLSDEAIDEIELIVLNQSNFFGIRSME